MTADVSVIIAAYNVGSYIERAIRSALDQQGVAVEVIVVNDASTDKTAEIVLGITDPRIKFISLPHNSGASTARNAGIAAASGTWISILDGDDAFAVDRLKTCLQCAQKSNADIVIDNLRAQREEDGTTFLMFPSSFFNRLQTLDLATFIAGNRSFLGGGIALGYAKPLIKRAFLQEHNLRYDPAIRIGEDYMLMAEALASGAICAVEKSAGYLYTVRAGSTSHRLSLDDIRRIETGDKKFTARYQLAPSALAAQAKREAGLHEAYAFTKLVDALKRRDIGEALRVSCAHPSAIWNLWRPLAARLRRIMSGNKIIKGKTILLFYREYEADKFIKYDRFLKRLLRPLYHLIHHRQKKTGFAVAFDLMCRSLKKAGYDVRVNDYRSARENPDYPVGIVGFPVILEKWSLPNPAVLGPSLYDHPMLAPDLFKDSRFKKYVTLAPWVFDIFAPVYGNRCFSWFVGIDTETWPDLSGHPKTYDFLIYDKLYWDRDRFDSTLIQPILKMLDRKGLTYKRVRYKMYDHAIYKTMLREARAMLYLSAHETQGLACQEAMASGLPVLAWNQGIWLDPLWKKFSSTAPTASSVPFFSPACGETFRDFPEFEAVLDRFLAKLPSYRPRAYVEENLNMQKSAQIYANQYFGLQEKTSA